MTENRCVVLQRSMYKDAAQMMNKFGADYETIGSDLRRHEESDEGSIVVYDGIYFVVDDEFVRAYPSDPDKQAVNQLRKELFSRGITTFEVK